MWIANWQYNIQQPDVDYSFLNKKQTRKETKKWIKKNSLVAQTVKNLPAMQETWVRSLGWESALEKEMETHSSVLAWRIPGTGEPDGLPSMGSHRVGHDWRDLATAAPGLWALGVSEFLQLCDESIELADDVWQGYLSSCGGKVSVLTTISLF